MAEMETKREEINKILCPIVLTEVSLKIIQCASLFADSRDAEIHLLNVVRDLTDHETLGCKFSAWNLIDVTNVARDKLRAFKSRYNSIVAKCKSAVIPGIADREILRYVVTKGIDLVVIGTHGRRSPEEIDFGSVAHRIVRQCPVPVVTVNPYKF